MIYFIVNEKSQTGKGADVWNKVRNRLDDRHIGYRHFVTRYRGHATYLASKISNLNREHVNIVVVGGDGTVNETINGIKDFEKVRLGLIPAGSGNDFARGLGVKGDCEQLIDELIDGVCALEDKKSIQGAMEKYTDRIDLGCLTIGRSREKRYFCISAGIGMDAIVCKKALTSRLKKLLNRVHMGKLTYLLLTIITLFSMNTYNVSVDFSDGRKRHLRKMIFSAAMNQKAEGGGVPMAPKADPRDGKLSMCSAHGIPKWKTFFILPFLVAAKHERFDGMEVMNFEKAVFHSDRPVTLHADGEYCGDIKEFSVRCEKGKLCMLKNYFC